MAKKSGILSTIHKSLVGLHRAGVVDEATMREFDALCLPSRKGKDTGRDQGPIRTDRP